MFTNLRVVLLMMCACTRHTDSKGLLVEPTSNEPAVFTMVEHIKAYKVAKASASRTVSVVYKIKKSARTIKHIYGPFQQAGETKQDSAPASHQTLLAYTFSHVCYCGFAMQQNLHLLEATFQYIWMLAAFIQHVWVVGAVI